MMSRHTSRPAQRAFCVSVLTALVTLVAGVYGGAADARAFAAKDDFIDVESGVAQVLHPELNDGVGSASIEVGIVSAPVHGTVKLLDDGAEYSGVLYTPVDGYRGQDSFTYSIKRNEVTLNATVHLNVDRFGPSEVSAEPRWTGAFVEWDNPASTEIVDPILVYRPGTTPMTSPDQGTVVPGVDGYESAAFVHGLSNNEPYVLTLFSQYDDGEVVVGESTTVVPQIEPVRGLRATAKNGAVRLDWTPPTGAKEIDVYWSTSGINAPGAVLGASATSYTVTGLTNGEYVDFDVVAADKVDDGNPPFPHSSDAAITAAASARKNTAPVGKDQLMGYVPGQRFSAWLNVTDAEDDYYDLAIYDWTQPSHGIVTECTMVLGCTYEPDAVNPTTDSFTTSVSDGHGGTATMTTSLYPRFITAVDDTFDVPAGQYAYLDVLANDMGLEPGDTLHCQAPVTADTCVADDYGNGWQLRVKVNSVRSAVVNYRIITDQGQTADVGQVNLNAVSATKTVPSPPTIGSASSGDRGGKVTATARWAPPSSDGHSPITSYVVQALRLNAKDKVVSKVSATVGAAKHSLTMRLDSGRYMFRVRAVNAIGQSSWSARSNIVHAR